MEPDRSKRLIVPVVEVHPGVVTTTSCWERSISGRGEIRL
jgi:hypothetical protein